MILKALPDSMQHKINKHRGFIVYVSRVYSEYIIVKNTLL